MSSSLACVLTLFLATTALAKNYTWGNRTQDDRLMQSGFVVRSPKKESTQSVNVYYPAKGLTNHLFITFINITDNFNCTSRVTVFLRSGGPGYQNAMLNFRSQQGRGFNATLSFYGRHNNSKETRSKNWNTQELDFSNFNGT